jgi:hypothetical protein
VGGSGACPRADWPARFVVCVVAAGGLLAGTTEDDFHAWC